ncbi:MAG: hypothetical protein FWH22_10135, partial [Fibromonadales bacterium]|nr:hypothetical protein [Fibromonadales bacterium]
MLPKLKQPVSGCPIQVPQTKARYAQKLTEYMRIILRIKQDSPVLIDKYLLGPEIEVDAICDGDNVFIPGIMEQVERTGIHSGDSIAVYPPPDLNENMKIQVLAITEKICKALSVRGLVNIQFVLY